MSRIHPALEKVWQGLRDQNADVVAQPLPVRFLILLCELNERERSLSEGVLKPGDIVRLKIGSKEMIVSRVIDADTVECTYFDGQQQFATTVQAADAQKVETPRDPNLPPPG